MATKSTLSGSNRCESKGNGYILIRAALVYRGRTIPLSWRVIKHGSTSVGFIEYESILEEVLHTLPKDETGRHAHADIVFLADRGFVHKKFVEFCRHHQVHFRIRVKSNTIIKFNDHHVTHAGQLHPPTGCASFYNNVSILTEGIGTINLAAANAADAKEAWYIITDEEADLSTLDDYALRFDIEENFLDDKSNGFQAESSKLKDADKLSRLFLIVAIATLYFTTVGVVNLNKRRWVDDHWDRGMSYFKIGWKWLKQQFNKGWRKINWFWLDPSADPQPAIASRTKAATASKKRVWQVFYQRAPTMDQDGGQYANRMDFKPISTC